MFRAALVLLFTVLGPFWPGKTWQHTEVSYLASGRNSVLSMLYGRYVENGTIKLDETLADLGFTDVGGLLDIEKRVTVEYLISARSGVYHRASKTGRNIFDALETDLARPIGMQDFDRKIHEKSGDMDRSIHPAYHMHFSTRDMARIGSSSGSRTIRSTAPFSAQGAFGQYIMVIPKLDMVIAHKVVICDGTAPDVWVDYTIFSKIVDAVVAARCNGTCN